MRWIVMVLVSCAMLCASFLPWLRDPLGMAYSAWLIPFNGSWLNNGLVIICCACLTVFIILAKHPALPGRDVRCVLAGALCLVPVILFVWHYLWNDVSGMALLAQHERQALLVQQHFGYHVAVQLLPLDPFTLSDATLWGRWQLLVNLVSFGPLLPCLCVCVIIRYRRWLAGCDITNGSRDHVYGVRGEEPTNKATGTNRHQQRGSNRYLRVVGWLGGITIALLVLIGLGRAPLGSVCEEIARIQLAQGDYTGALDWLDRARYLHPALDQVAYYHIERGQALYFQHPEREGDESRAYLVSFYRARGDDLNAYLQLQALQQAHPGTSWIVGEMAITLQHLAETSPKLRTTLLNGGIDGAASLVWLQLLTQVDPTNVYGMYMSGRVHYELHDFAACQERMGRVLLMSQDRDMQSSAYTYMALSSERLGDYRRARDLLFEAVALDPNYHNNTAREELSGLH